LRRRGCRRCERTSEHRRRRRGWRDDRSGSDWRRLAGRRDRFGCGNRSFCRRSLRCRSLDNGNVGKRSFADSSFADSSFADSSFADSSFGNGCLFDNWSVHNGRFDSGCFFGDRSLDNGCLFGARSFDDGCFNERSFDHRSWSNDSVDRWLLGDRRR